MISLGYFPEGHGEHNDSIAVNPETIKEIIETIEPLRDNEADDMSPSSSCNKDTVIEDKSDEEDQYHDAQTNEISDDMSSNFICYDHFEVTDEDNLNSNEQFTKHTDRDTIIKDKDKNKQLSKSARI